MKQSGVVKQGNLMSSNINETTVNENQYVTLKLKCAKIH